MSLLKKEIEKATSKANDKPNLQQNIAVVEVINS